MGEQSRRQRLISGLVAIVVFAAAGDALAQDPRNPYNCQRIPSGNVVQSTADSPVPLIRNQISTGDRAAVEQVRNTCQRELRSGRGRAHNLEAYECVADATLRMAEFGDRENNYRAAICEYQTTAALASRARANIIEGRAHERRGATLLNLRSLRSAESAEAARILQDAMGAYNAAIAANDTSLTRFALGRAYISLRDLPNAQTQILRGQQMTPTGSDTAMALVALADARLAADPNADVVNILRDAQTAASNSSAVNGALGVAYYRMGRDREAEAAFRAAVGQGSVDDAGPLSGAYRSESNYYLSLISAQRGDWTGAINYAQSAGDVEFRYRAQECLAHIGRGNESVRNPRSPYRLIPSPGSAACQVDSSPEGQLLLGMYYMREAQSFNIGNRVMLDTPERQSYRDAIGAAANAFNQGAAGLTRLPESERRCGNGQRAGCVSWVRSDVDLLAMLQYGAQVLAFECAGAPQQVNDPEVRRRGREFYSMYQLASCRPS